MQVAGKLREIREFGVEEHGGSWILGLSYPVIAAAFVQAISCDEVLS